MGLPDSWQGMDLDPPNFRPSSPIPPIRRPIAVMGTGTPVDPYSAQLDTVQTSRSNLSVPAAPIFLTTFMPIPSPMNLDHFETILPLDLTRNQD